MGCWGCLMSWRDDITAGLPAPQDDDPQSLRQDIADELSDHLQCATNRELLRSPNESSESDVRMLVLSRFGQPPDQLARRLWFDALQETLMSKRLTLAFVIVLTAVSVTACAMTWSRSEAMRMMALEARHQTELLLKQRDAENRQLLEQNQQLLEKLAAASDAPPARSLDWNPLKVRISLDNTEKAPGQEFSIDLWGNAHTASEEARLYEVTDVAGVADFGVVRPGTYQVRVTCPWGEFHQESIQVRPGSDRVVDITVPNGPPESVTVRPSVQWPEAIADKGLALLCFARSGDERHVENRSFRDRTDHCLLFLPDGRIAQYDHAATENDQVPRSLGQTSKDDDVLAQCRFYGEPRMLGTSIDWQGQTARFRAIHLVKLPDSEPPADQATVPVLTPSFFLQRYEQFFSVGDSGRRPSEAQREDSLEFHVDEPDWLVTIPEQQLRETIAMLTVSDHPDASRGRVAVGMMVFLRADSDSDGSLSEEEVEQSSRTHRITFSEFPVEQKTFLDAYLESRSSRTGGLGSRSR